MRQRGRLLSIGSSRYTTTSNCFQRVCSSPSISLIASSAHAKFRPGRFSLSHWPQCWLQQNTRKFTHRCWKTTYSFAIRFTRPKISSKWRRVSFSNLISIFNWRHRIASWKDSRKFKNWTKSLFSCLNICSSLDCLTRKWINSAIHYRPFLLFTLLKSTWGVIISKIAVKRRLVLKTLTWSSTSRWKISEIVASATTSWRTWSNSRNCRWSRKNSKVTSSSKWLE